MTLKKLLARMFRIQNHVNVVVTRCPRIMQQLAAQTLKLLCRIIPQKIQRLTQRLSPRLVPTRLTPCVTPTIARPPRNAMHAAPRAAFAIRSVIDFHFGVRRITIEILPVVCDPKTGRLRFNPQRMRQTEISKLEMMAVSL